MTNPLTAATAAATATDAVLGGTDAPTAPAPAPALGMGLVADVPVELSVVLGRVRLPMRELAQLGPGQVYTLAGAKDAPVDVLANGHLVARGVVVAVDDEYGVEVTEVVRGSA